MANGDWPKLGVKPGRFGGLVEANVVDGRERVGVAGRVLRPLLEATAGVAPRFLASLVSLGHRSFHLQTVAWRCRLRIELRDLQDIPEPALEHLPTTRIEGRELPDVICHVGDRVKRCDRRSIRGVREARVEPGSRWRVAL